MDSGSALRASRNDKGKDMPHHPCCLRRCALGACAIRAKEKPAPWSTRATSPLLFEARGRRRLYSSPPAPWCALEVFLIRAAQKRGRAERRTRDASAASCVKVSVNTRAVVTTKTPGRPAFRTRWFFRLASCSPRWRLIRLGSSPSGLRVSCMSVDNTGSPSLDASGGHRDHTTWAGAQRHCE